MQAGDVGHAFVHGHGIKVAPQRGADEAHTVHHHGFTVQPDQAQLFTGALQALAGFVKVLHVVFVIAGHKQHGRGPARVLRQRRKALQPKMLTIQLGTALVGTNIAGQHQHISARSRFGHKLGVDFKVQV